MKTLFIINCPWYFTAIYSIFKPFIDQKTATKFQLCGSNFLPTLEKYIDRRDIPSDMGELFVWYCSSCLSGYSLIYLFIASLSLSSVSVYVSVAAGGDQQNYPWLQFVPDSGATEETLIWSFYRRYGNLKQVPRLLLPNEIELVLYSFEIRGHRTAIPPSFVFSKEALPSLSDEELLRLAEVRPKNVNEVLGLLVPIPPHVPITAASIAGLSPELAELAALNRHRLKTFYDVCKLFNVELLFAHTQPNAHDAVKPPVVDLRPFLGRLLSSGNLQANTTVGSDDDVGGDHHTSNNVSRSIGSEGAGAVGDDAAYEIDQAMFDQLVTCVLEVYFCVRNLGKPAHGQQQPETQPQAQVRAEARTQEQTAGNGVHVLPSLTDPVAVADSPRTDAGAQQADAGVDTGSGDQQPTDSGFLNQNFLDGDDDLFNPSSGTNDVHSTARMSSPMSPASLSSSTSRTAPMTPASASPSASASVSQRSHTPSFSSTITTNTQSTPPNLTAYSYNVKRQSWAEAAGRTSGGSGYKLGDFTKSVVRKYSSTKSSKSRSSFAVGCTDSRDVGAAGGANSTATASLSDEEYLKLLKTRIIGTEVSIVRCVVIDHVMVLLKISH